MIRFYPLPFDYRCDAPISHFGVNLESKIKYDGLQRQADSVALGSKCIDFLFAAGCDHLAWRKSFVCA